MTCYKLPHRLIDPVGNNALSHDIRENKSLFIPSIIHGSLSDVQIGMEVVFADRDEQGILRECIGLESFVKTDWNGIPVIVFDNHNHALYFWCEAIVQWTVSFGSTLIHIDEHSDLWENQNDLEVETWLITSLQKVFDFTNYQCNVGNYIQPALRSGLIKKMLRIEGEGDMEKYESYEPEQGESMILNLDLDFFAPELDYIPYARKKALILQFAKHVKLITIATSPFFIDQNRAIEVLNDIFGSK